MPYDLLIKGGHVFDPGQGLDGVMDIGITGGKIAAIEPDIATTEAKRHIVVKGQRRYVTPGLIDIHTHCAYGMTSPGVNWIAAPPDIAGVHSGVTTIVDCGTCGAYNFGVVPTYVAPNAKTRTIYFLNIGSYGLMTQALHKARPEVSDPSHIDLDSTFACANANAAYIKGIKLRLVGAGVETMGTKMVDLAVEAARTLKLPLMPHVGDIMSESPKAPELTRYLLTKVQPGDIITHVCSSHSGALMGTDGKVLPQARDAKDAGVIMDPASGRSNWSNEVCRIEAQQGFHPDTISTDMTVNGRVTTIFSLMEAMAKFMACGYTLEQVVRMTTLNAAKALNLQDQIGAIKVGYDADLSIIDQVTGRWRYIDSSAQYFTGEDALIPVQTVRAGELIAPEWGPHPWGWLPEEA